MAPSLAKPWFPVETWRGHVISQRGRSFRVADIRFKSLRDARAFIDGDEEQRARAVRQLARRALTVFRADDGPHDTQAKA